MRSTHDEPHLRHDPLAGRTVFVAPQRAGRPNELEGGPIRCPFCSGNESLTPPDVLRAPPSTTGPWQARIVPNRFPVVAAGHAEPTAGEPEPPQADGVRPATGVHDVVIESPAHVRSILAIEPAGWLAVWELCRQRLEQLSLQEDIAWATVFKNSGVRAGASLEHVHSQLVGLDFVPPTIGAELAATRNAADPFGALLAAAAAEGRVVEESGDLVALVPPAPRQPFETWILPRTAEPYFHATRPERISALATLTQSFVGRLERLSPQADYNWWLHQPAFSRGTAGRPSPDLAARQGHLWHWHLEIMPRINGLAGFELGTGCHITTEAPIDSARRLRDA